MSDVCQEDRPIAAPPLGCRPRKFWLQSRATELVLAIERNYNVAPSTINFELVGCWIDELQLINDELALVIEDQAIENETAALIRHLFAEQKSHNAAQAGKQTDAEKQKANFVGSHDLNVGGLQTFGKFTSHELLSPDEIAAAVIFEATQRAIKHVGEMHPALKQAVADMRQQQAKQTDPETYRHKEFPDEAERLAEVHAKQAEAEAERAAANDGGCAEDDEPVPTFKEMKAALGVLGRYADKNALSHILVNNAGAFAPAQRGPCSEGYYPMRPFVRYGIERSATETTPATVSVHTFHERPRTDTPANAAAMDAQKPQEANRPDYPGGPIKTKTVVDALYIVSEYVQKCGYEAMEVYATDDRRGVWQARHAQDAANAATADFKPGFDCPPPPFMGSPR